MLRRWPRLLFLLPAGLLVVGLVLALLAPSLIAALPSQVRGRLPEDVIRAMTTPLPTALPLPLNVAAATPVPLAELLPAATPAATAVLPSATATPSATTPPTATEFIDPTMVAAFSDPDLAPATSSPTPLPTATPSPSPSPTPRPTRLPETVRITGLEIVPQKFNNCGSANMSVMLNYYGLPVTQQDISAVIKPQYDDRNVTPEELAAYVNEHTELQAAVYRGGSLDTLRLLLQAGFPVIIEEGYEPDAWQGWMGHYLTLFGYDNESGSFLSLDTFLGPWDSSGRAVSYDDLSTSWAQFNHAFLVVHRPFEADELAALLGPDYTDETRMWQRAAARAEAATAEQPDNAFGWFNLGMSLTRLADQNGDAALYSAAATAFDQSRIAGLPPRMMWYQFEPYRAYLYGGRPDETLALAEAVMSTEGGRDSEEAHFYQGLALREFGRLDEALSAFRRAVELKPGFTAAQEMLEQ